MPPSLMSIRMGHSWQLSYCITAVKSPFWNHYLVNIFPVLFLHHVSDNKENAKEQQYPKTHLFAF